MENSKVYVLLIIVFLFGVCFSVPFGQSTTTNIVGHWSHDTDNDFLVPANTSVDVSLNNNSLIYSNLSTMAGDNVSWDSVSMAFDVTGAGFGVWNLVDGTIYTRVDGNDVQINGTVNGSNGEFSYLDVGNDANVSGALSSATLNTGQGANELYEMNQDVATYDSVRFLSLYLSQYLFHYADLDTYIEFTPDRIGIKAGDKLMISCIESGIDEVVVNDDGGVVTFRVEGDTDVNLIYAKSLTDRVGIGTNSPNAKLEVKGLYSGTVGGFPSGILHVTTSDNSEFANSVITGHNSYTGNTQLWYLGSVSNSNNDIAFINRQYGSLSLWTNNTKRFMITKDGNVGIGTNNPSSKLQVVGDVNISGDVQMDENLTVGSVVNTTGGNSTGWNLAFGWGDHGVAGYLTSRLWNDNGTTLFPSTDGRNIQINGSGDGDILINNSNISSTETLTLGTPGDNIIMCDSVYPNESEVHSFGSPEFWWDNGYFSGKLYVNGTIDPPCVLFNKETLANILGLIERDIPKDDDKLYGGLVQWGDGVNMFAINPLTKHMEQFVWKSDYDALEQRVLLLEKQMLELIG